MKYTFSKYNDLCDETKNVNVTLLELLPKDEAAKHETLFKAKMLNGNEWLAETQSSPANDDDGGGDNDK